MARPDGIRTTCPYCGVGCGLIAQVDAAPDGTEPVVTVRGDPAHPANLGRLCSKGAALGETLGAEGRLLYPEIGGQRVPWATALDHVASGLRAVIERHGPEAVAFYVSGQLLTEDYYVANKLMKGFIGSGNIDTNSRLCMATPVAAQIAAFGVDGVPGCYADLELADLVVLAGSNLAWTHPVLFQRLQAARARRPNLRVVVIDPRRTATAEAADLHLPLAPGTDAWLFNGLLHHLRREDRLDLGFLERHTEGFSATLEAARASAGSIPETAIACGLEPADVATFFRWFATTERTVTAFSQGINQSDSGVAKVASILNVHLATGRIGQPGMGPFSLTGQPNAMGGREVGGLATQLAAHMRLDDPEARERVRRFWQAPAVAVAPGLKAVDLFRAVEEGRIKALWIMGTNPLFSLPEAARFEKALADCPLVVVSDCVRATETTGLAHVLLPAAAWGEKDGTVTNSERCISRQRAFLPAPGGARADWWILTQVARRLGFSEAFPYQSPAEIFREHARLSAFENHGERAFDLGALGDLDAAAYQHLEPVQWPLPAGEAPQGTPRLYAKGRFFTPSGRARLVPVTPQGPTEALDTHLPLRLNTGRLRDQWHSMTRTGRAARLSTHEPEPFVALAPGDAVALGLQRGDLAEVGNRQGRIFARVRFAPEQRPGEVFVPIHWSRPFATASRVNALVPARTDPISGQPAFKHAAVSVRPAAMRWHAFVLSRHPVTLPEADYRVTVSGIGHRRDELAGQGPAPDWARWAKAVGIGNPERAPEWLEFADPAGGRYRAALLREGRLLFTVFAGPGPALPDRAWLAGLFASEGISDAERSALLSGRAPGGPSLPTRTICACFAVSDELIRKTIDELGLTSCDAVGRQLQAGTNCGSCRPEIEALLRQAGLVPLPGTGVV